MGVRSADLLSAARLLSEAPFAADGWSPALARMAAATGGGHGQVCAFTTRRGLNLNVISDIAESQLALAEPMGSADPDQSWRIAASGPPLTISAEDDYARARPRVRSERYDELCAQLDIFNGMQTVLAIGEGYMVGLATLRGRADGKTSADDRRRFAQLSPFALNAVRMQQAMADEGQLLVLGLMEAMRCAALLCDDDGRVCGMTPAAETLLDAGRLRLVGGRLHAARPAVDDRLGDALAGARTGLHARVWLPTGDRPADGAFMDVFALPRRDWDFASRPTILVTVTPPAGAGAIDRSVLQQVLKLTRAEAEVALAIAQGADREAIASTRGASVQTVRTQIRAIYDKTDVTREGELVALLNRFVGR